MKSKLYEKLADQLAGTGTDIWAIVGKRKTETFQREGVVQFFKDISDYTFGRPPSVAPILK